MVLTVSPRLKLYRKFELDIWGLSFTNYTYILPKFFWGVSRTLNTYSIFIERFGLRMMHKVQKIFFKMFEKRRSRARNRDRRYVYKFDLSDTYKKRKYHDERFVSVRITRLYFRTFKDFQFRKLFRRASKLDGNLESNYCYMLEGRLLSIIYRTHLLTNPFEIPNFIENDNVYIDFRIINRPNYLVPLSKFLVYKFKIYKKLVYNLSLRLRYRTVPSVPPRFIYSSYELNFFYLLRYPVKRDLMYPIAIDMQRLTGFH